MKTDVDPIPHNALNRTSAGWGAYEYIGWLFGFCLGNVNWVVWGAFCGEMWKVEFPERWQSTLWAIFNMLILWPALLFLAIMPFFGFWIVDAIESSVSLLTNVFT